MDHLILRLSKYRLHLFQCLNDYKLLGVFRDELERFTLTGQYMIGREHNKDLFMAEKPKFLWINLFQQLHENGNYVTTVHTREDLADLEIENNINFKHIQKLTIIL